MTKLMLNTYDPVYTGKNFKINEVKNELSVTWNKNV